MKLTKKDILHVARLSNLTLTEKEIETFLPQLSKVVDFVGQLSEVDTKDVEPASQTTRLQNVTRKDVVNTSNILSQKQALSGAKNTQGGLFRVPALLAERTDK